jgi:cysteine synthase A
VKIGLADPYGASLYSWYADGELKSEGTSISEGIGQGRITANLEGLAVDFPFRVSDEEMLEQVFDLVQHEGLCLGGSTGINVAGAMRMAKEWGPATPS